MKYNNSRFTIILPLVIAISIIGGMLIARYVFVPNAQIVYPQSNGINKLDLILDYINRRYVDSVDVNKILEKAIPVVLEQLDPHSSYISSDEFQEMNEPLEGEFEGIGVQFNVQKDTVVIVQVIAGGPSEKVNIMPGDRIVKVNDSLVAGVGITSGKIVKLLKGPKGTKVKVGIKRKNKSRLLDFIIVRDKIPLYSIDVSYMPAPEIGYIKISRFALKTYDEFYDHAKTLMENGMKKLIIDLRGNGGGYLVAATDIANELLRKGKLIVYTEGNAARRRDYYSTKDGMCKDVELVVLIDEMSASASEILAGAMQDNDRGLIIGRRSFGKGLVMEQHEFSDMSALRLTTARYYTPTGRCIQKPYGNGNDVYFHEIDQRVQHGELSEKDSIVFNDSLAYKTPEGKTVYGGGGIMPDVFIPLDTVGYTDLLSDVISLGILYEYCFDYADRHRDELSKLHDPESFIAYVKQRGVLNDFIDFTKDKGIKVSEEDIEISKDVLLNRLAAFIARNILDDKGFYPIYLKIDKAFNKSISILQEDIQ